MNYLKDAIDFVMTLRAVKNHLAWRNQNNFLATGINARLIQRDSNNPNRLLIQINFDYYNNNNSIQEDFFVRVEWNGNQYIPINGSSVIELDGID